MSHAEPLLQRYLQVRTAPPLRTQALLAASVLLALSRLLDLDITNKDIGRGLEDFLGFPMSPVHLNLLVMDADRGEANRLVAGLDVSSPDVLSELYSSATPAELRKQSGEYYTPLWLASVTLSRLGSLKGLVVEDPFCGTGAFLAAAIELRLRAGEGVEEAYRDLVGLDSNPLAALMARTVMVSRYLRASGKAPALPPAVYIVDTLAEWYGSDTDWSWADPLGVMDSLRRTASAHVDDIIGGRPRELIRSLQLLEITISTGLREGDVAGRLRSENLGPLEHLVEDARLAKTLRDLERLARVYGPYGWAMLVSSAVASALIPRALRPDVIATNPPWIQLTSYKALGSRDARRAIVEAVKSLGIRATKAAQLANGSDVATAALLAASRRATNYLAFVMSSTQAFWPATQQRSGILAVYAALRGLRSSMWDVELIWVDVDVFGHGVRPSLVIARAKGHGSASLLSMSSSSALRPLNLSYDDYVESLIAWASSDAQQLANALGVKEVKPMGGYVRGVFGGPRGLPRRYAGLAVKEYWELSDVVRIRLFNTSRAYEVPLSLLRDLDVAPYRLYYHSMVRPFSCEPVEVMLSPKGDKALRDFIRALAELADSGDREALEALASELRAQPDLLDEGGIYVIYRGKYAFSACTLRAPSRAASYSNIGYLKCISEEQANYYTGALNYLAYKAVERGGKFIRDQYSRPLMALVEAGLSWNSVDDEVRREAPRLSVRAAEEARASGLRSPRELESLPGFRELAEVLNNTAGPRLYRALSLISYAL